MQMTVSIDMRWRAIVLTYVCGVDVEVAAVVLGVSRRFISRWSALFQRQGNVIPSAAKQRRVRWPRVCLAFVNEYVQAHPCFYIEELQEAIKAQFPTLGNVSTSAICRALRFDLGLTRKILTKRARESIPAEIDLFYRKLVPFYGYPE